MPIVPTSLARLLLVTGVFLVLVLFTSTLWGTDSRSAERVSMPIMSNHGSGFKPAEPVQEFLTSTRDDFLQAVQSQKGLDKWTIVMGNEAGGGKAIHTWAELADFWFKDLDSVASAVAFAYCAHRLAGVSGRRFAPLVQINRSDLGLRPENVAALQSCGINEADLITLDDVPKDKSQLGPITYVLVDHNVLAPDFGARAHVIAVLDHHEDEGHYPDASPRVVRQCGSCSSLVTTHFAPHLSGSPMVPRDLADLIIYAILIDTANLKPAPKGKAEDVDRAAMATLVPLSSFAVNVSFTSSDSVVDLARTFEDLSTSKSNVGHLSAYDLLRRDYKEVVVDSGWKVGLSTVPLCLEEALIRSSEPLSPHHLDPLRAWQDERHLDAAVILTSYSSKENGKRAREILAMVRVDQSQLVHAVFETFPHSAPEVLNLKTWPGQVQATQLTSTDGQAVARVWQQGNAKSTRKQVAPALRRVLEEIQKPKL